MRLIIVAIALTTLILLALQSAADRSRPTGGEATLASSASPSSAVARW